MGTKNKYDSKTDQELARIQSMNHHQSEEFILAEKAWQKRLSKEQIIMTSFATGIWTVIGVILGYFLGLKP